MTTINFDDLAFNTVVSNQYSGVTFSTEPGNLVKTYSGENFGNSPPNAIGTYTSSGGLNGNLNLNVDFAQPVSNLSFFTIGDNSVNAAKIDVYTTTGSPITVDIIADGDYLTKELVDL